jgi:hypothetical protein
VAQVELGLMLRSTKPLDFFLRFVAANSRVRVMPLK